MNAAVRWLVTQSLLLATLVLGVRTFVAYGWLRPVVVVGESMQPNLPEGERVMVRRWEAPRRWDVVVVRSPDDGRRLAIKRVVGLPGERISLRNGEVRVNNRPARPRNPEASKDVYYGAHGNPVWTLGADEWFVAGDNQAVSVDSRHWGPTPGRLIEGVVATTGHRH